MKIRIEIDQNTLRKLVIAHIRDLLGDHVIVEQRLRIETKSAQNYRSEWEADAGFRAVYEERT